MSRETFHHGDLRRSIIDATIRLIDAKGVRGFTLADASREAGVSKSAPYRHFNSKEAILIAVAIDCFDRFESDLVHAGDAPDPRAALRGMLDAYLNTAIHRTAEFRTMFASGIDKGSHRELSQRAERCFNHLRTGVVRCQALANATRRDATIVTMQLWISVHGISVLAIDGSLKKLGGKQRLAALLDDLMETQLEHPPRQ